MKETARMAKLFKAGYDGSPWLDVNLVDTLQHIDSVQASTKISPGWNSIWEIVAHIISWRTNVLKRVQGEVITTPVHNYFVPVKNTSAKAWADTLQKLEASQAAWISFLNEFNEKDLANVYPNNNLSYYEHIHGILQHDVYHLGQIVLLMKVIH